MPSMECKATFRLVACQVIMPRRQNHMVNYFMLAVLYANALNYYYQKWTVPSILQ